MTLEASIAGLTFIGDGGAATYTIGDDGLKGWLIGGAGMRRENVDRSTSHGAFDAPGFLTGRTVTLSGLVKADTPETFEDALAALSALLADGDTATLTVETANGETTAEVCRYREPDIKIVVYGSVAEYQAQLWAPDPRRYGASNTFGPGTSLDVTHGGNFPAIPVVTVAGPVTAPYTVASDGHSVTVTQSVTSGHEHTIDMATGWVSLDGVLQAAVTSAVDVFTIPPGAGATVTGPSTMTVDVADTFV